MKNKKRMGTKWRKEKARSKVRYRKGSEMRRKDQLKRVKEKKQGKGKKI